MNLTQTAKFEIVKPVNGTWSDLGDKLRALSAPLPRVLNAIVTDLELAHRSGKFALPPVDAEDGTLRVHPQTLAYQIAVNAWRVERQAAQERAAKSKRPTLDVLVSEHEPLSHLCTAASAEAFTRWKKYDKDRFLASSSLPSFRAGSPIFLQAKGVALGRDDHGSVLTVKLTRDPAAKGNRALVERLAVKPTGPKDHHLLRLVVGGEGKVGDAKIRWDKRKKKWFAMVAITHEVTERQGDRTMALHRGVTTFLSYAISGEGGRDPEAGVFEDGAAILAHKNAYSARRRSLGHHGKSLGKGAKGHGVTRRHQRITRLEDAEARWIRTKCQETAAHAMKLAGRRGVTRIVIEDWTNPAKDGAEELGEWMERVVRTFPLAQLRETILWAAKKRGIEVVVRPGAFQSCTCPRCGHVNAAPPTTGIFRCEDTGCLFERSREVVAAIHLLRADDKPFDTKALARATARAAASLGAHEPVLARQSA